MRRVLAIAMHLALIISLLGGLTGMAMASVMPEQVDTMAAEHGAEHEHASQRHDCDGNVHAHAGDMSCFDCAACAAPLPAMPVMGGMAAAQPPLVLDTSLVVHTPSREIRPPRSLLV